MPSYTNRFAESHFVTDVREDYDSKLLTFYTSNGSVFTVPLNPLTSKMYPDEKFIYTLEFHRSTFGLVGIVSPDGTVLYRINDSQAAQVARTPDFTAQLAKGGVPIDQSEALEVMIGLLDDVWRERLKRLPDEYLYKYFMYEVKVSYLASVEGSDYLFDPTPGELMHAITLKMSNSADFPGFFN